MAREKSLEERLEDSRIVMLYGPVTSEVASRAICRLLQLSAEDDKADIHIYFGTTYGSALNILAIYDTICAIPNDVTGTCMGHVMGYTTLLLACCTKGKRYALKHAIVSLDQTTGVLSPGSNQQTEIEIAAREATKGRAVFEELMAKATSQDLSKVHSDCEVGNEFSAKEALEYGIIDKILERGE